MAAHRESFAEDVGGKLLLLSSMLTVFAILALVLMPLGAAFAPPQTPPAAAASPAATPDTPSPETTATPPASVTPPTTVPEGPPPFVAAFMPGIIMLVIAAVIGILAGLLLGYSKARAEEAEAPQPDAPH
jgi:ABC-type glycerol-3-phosphate transport system permease component